MPKGSVSSSFQELWIGRAPNPDSEVPRVRSPGRAVTKERTGSVVGAQEDLGAPRPPGDDGAEEDGG